MSTQARDDRFVYNVSLLEHEARRVAADAEPSSAPASLQYTHALLPFSSPHGRCHWPMSTHSSHFAHLPCFETCCNAGGPTWGSATLLLAPCNSTVPSQWSCHKPTASDPWQLSARSYGLSSHARPCMHAADAAGLCWPRMCWRTQAPAAAAACAVWLPTHALNNQPSSNTPLRVLQHRWSLETAAAATAAARHGHCHAAAHQHDSRTASS